MIKEEKTITVYENNDPLVAVHIDVEDANGVETPYDFTNATEIEFVIKKGVAVADTDATAVYTKTGTEVTVVGPATNGDLTIQMVGTDLGTASVQRYRIDVIKNSKRETIMLGPFVITNV